MIEKKTQAIFSSIIPPMMMATGAQFAMGRVMYYVTGNATIWTIAATAATTAGRRIDYIGIDTIEICGIGNAIGINWVWIRNGRSLGLLLFTDAAVVVVVSGIWKMIFNIDTIMNETRIVCLIV